MTPWLLPLVPLMCAPVALMFVQSFPRPPAHLESAALSAMTLKMCARSSSTVER